MTEKIWRDALAQFAMHGTDSEQLMAKMLLSLSHVDDPIVVRLFDSYASEILETKGST